MKASDLQNQLALLTSAELDNELTFADSEGYVHDVRSMVMEDGIPLLSFEWPKLVYSGTLTKPATWTSSIRCKLTDKDGVNFACSCQYEEFFQHPAWPEVPEYQCARCTQIWQVTR